MQQLTLFPVPPRPSVRRYGDALTITVNRKGVIDVDTVKGCTMGMRARPGTGCYEECYANRIAQRLGIDFSTSVSRKLVDRWQHRDVLIKQLLDQPQRWYRIGTMGDPCHDWNHTLNIIYALRHGRKTAVIITKHWVRLSDDHLSRLLDLDVVVNTSTSGMDTDAELEHRVAQILRLQKYGIRSVNRIVTCEYGDSLWAQACNRRQRYLLTITPIIDNPLRVSPTNPRVLSGEIRVTRRLDSVGGGTLVSLHDPAIYLGHCAGCPDQCGASQFPAYSQSNVEDDGVTRSLAF